MALEKMEALEARIRALVVLLQELKVRNAHLEEALKLARDRAAQQAELNRQWEHERTEIRLRVEKVLEELESLEARSLREEVALD